jgi:hypothetical protein
VYVLKEPDVDSIIYANGKVDKFPLFKLRRNLKENIPQLNTWTLDPIGFGFVSVSQSYERRLKNGKVGFRVPLYIAYYGGGFAGAGTFQPGAGVYTNQNYNGGDEASYAQGGSALSTGLNVKCYLFRRRIIRAFAGPEATIGYTAIKTDDYQYNNNIYGNTVKTIAYGTTAILAKVGVSFNPLDKFNITVEGGAGAGNIFGHSDLNTGITGFTGVWQIGLSLGTNF